MKTNRDREREMGRDRQTDRQRQTDRDRQREREMGCVCMGRECMTYL